VVRFATRFVIVTDYQQLLAKDTKTSETLIIDIRDIGNHFAFFLPWAGMEKAQYTTESHAGLMQVKGTPKVANPEGWLEGCSSCLTLIQVSSVATLSLSR
jgi:hypothetical protein